MDEIRDCRCATLSLPIVDNTKDVQELIEEECFKDMSPPPELLIPEIEILGLGAGVKHGVFHSSVPHPPCPQCRVGWELISL